VPFRTYGEYKALHGTQEALRIVQSEYDALDLTAELVEVSIALQMKMKRIVFKPHDLQNMGVDVGFALRPHREISMGELHGVLQAVLTLTCLSSR
jgi:hypothetical protein